MIAVSLNIRIDDSRWKLRFLYGYELPEQGPKCDQSLFARKAHCRDNPETRSLETCVMLCKAPRYSTHDFWSSSIPIFWQRLVTFHCGNFFCSVILKSLACTFLPSSPQRDQPPASLLHPASPASAPLTQNLLAEGRFICAPLVNLSQPYPSHNLWRSRVLKCSDTRKFESLTSDIAPCSPGWGVHGVEACNFLLPKWVWRREGGVRIWLMTSHEHVWPKMRLRIWCRLVVRFSRWSLEYYSTPVWWEHVHLRLWW